VSTKVDEINGGSSRCFPGTLVTPSRIVGAPAFRGVAQTSSNMIYRSDPGETIDDFEATLDRSVILGFC
jgi:hypothetical protein